MTIRKSIWAAVVVVSVGASVSLAGTVVTLNNAGTSNNSFSVDLSAQSPVRTFSIDINVNVTPQTILSCQLKPVCSAVNVVQINSGSYNNPTWDTFGQAVIPVGLVPTSWPISSQGWIGAIAGGDPIVCLTGQVRLATLNMEVPANATPGIYTLNVVSIRSGDCATQENIGGTPGAAFTITVGPLAANPPVITSAVSRKTHTGAGAFDLDMINPLPSQPIAVECRQSGPTQVVITFDQNIAGVGGLDNSDVALASTGANPGTIGSVAIAGSQLTVNMSGTSDAARMKMSFPGICSSLNPAAVVIGSICAGVLTGDVTGDGNTNIFDLVAVRNNLNTATNASNFRHDVNGDGTINVLDLVVVRNQLNQSIPGACP